MTKKIPDGFHALTPHLVVRDGAAAIDFYKKAFGAQELTRMAMPGNEKKIMHALLKINDSMLMLMDEFPDMQAKGPASLGGSPITIHIYVTDVDAAVDRAVKAGAKVKMPVDDMFWGDRYGVITDPFGHSWSLATHVRDVAPAEMAKAAETACANSAAKAGAK
jgi:PhnB protein